MKFDPIQWTAMIPNPALRKRALDLILSVGIPFNRWLGFRISEMSPDVVEILSPPTTLRKNHVGGAHACALALMGEYPAGLLVATQYPLEKYRMIISALNIEYHKQGRGKLRARALAPESWPELTEGEAWIEMETKIRNEKDEEVATCKTKWQVKEWERVRSGKTAD